MKSRVTSPERSSQRPGLTWVIVPLAALVTSGVLGLALFGGSDRHETTLTGGPLLVADESSPLPRAAAVLPAVPDRPHAVAAVPSVPPAVPAALPTADDVAPMTLSAASRMVPIELYSASWCTACASAERWLAANDIAYSEIDVDRHPGARDQLVALNPRRTLPTFDVAGDVLVGFDPTRLGAAIEGAARRRNP